MDTTKNAIEVTNLVKRYKELVALDHFNLTVKTGEIFGLLGPNGSGKTTLIKILNGLLQPNFGSVMIDATPIGTYTKSQVSNLPDKNYFADWMTVKDIFDLFSDFYADFDRQKALRMCDSLGIGEGDRIKSMSKGTKEKVQEFTRNLILSFGKRGLLLGADCTVNEHIDHDRIRWVVEAARSI